MKHIRLLMNVMQRISPTLAAKIVYWRMSNPAVRKLRTSEEEVLAKAEQRNVPFQGFAIRKYEWGKGSAKTALLVHGWEGQAGNFAGMIDLLVEKEYHVISFDAPAHGKSSKGATSMFAFGQFLAEQMPYLNPDLVISHSFGSVSTAMTLRRNPQIKVGVWLMATTPFSFKNRISDVANQLGVNEHTQKLLIEKVEHRLQESIDNLNMANYCNTLHNVEKAVIVHSKADKVLPLEGARKVHEAFPQSEMVELEKVGHYAILWSEDLLEVLRKVA